ncbi:uncharacterized protein LTR77_009791 [Saxophila tyrrhenica]|uniref:Uncharacterized protein n=1 Tax=Saxophila tyrrhenica TaxID=1690608 RepID=A0AAV9NZZ7_9PEZI|nr:hypothetical protein LTR77_009791 [Saxophila tyrrhenica]
MDKDVKKLLPKPRDEGPQMTLPSLLTLVPLLTKDAETDTTEALSVPTSLASQPYDFLFVNASSTEAPQRSLNTAIRRHVRTDSRKPGSPEPSASHASSPTVQRFRLGGGGLREVVPRRKKTGEGATAPETFAASSVDPFDTFPVPNSPTVDLLVREYHEVIIKSSPLLVASRTACFALAMQDPAFFITKLCHAASRRALMSAGYAVEVLTLKSDTLRMIQQRLQSQDLGDFTIAAVATLVSNEVVYATEPSSIKVHMDGLAKLVGLRGGMTEAEFPFLIRRMIVWWVVTLDSSTVLADCRRADIQVACALFTVPRFSSLTLEELSQTVPGTIATAHSHPEAQDIMPTLLELRRQATILESGSLLTDHEGLALPEAFYHLQLRLLSIWQGSKHELHNFTKIWSVAGLMFLEYFLHGTLSGAPAVQRLCRQLRSLIEEDRSDPDGSSAFGKQDMALRLWIIFTASLASMGEDSFAWWSHELLHLCERVPLRSLSDAEALLQTVCWPERTASAASRKLWKKSQEEHSLLESS